MRDNQKSKVYGVEDDFHNLLSRSYDTPSLEVYGSNVILSPERNFGDIASIQRYVDSVLSLNWVKAQWGENKITVRKRKGDTRGHYNPTRYHYDLGTIAVPEKSRWVMREAYIIHEMAHHFNRTNFYAASHGAEFVGIELKLIEELMSPENAFVFTYLLTESGVDFTRLG